VGIYWSVVDANFVVEVRAGAASAVADVADGVAAVYVLSGEDGKAGEVSVTRRDSVAMVNRDRAPTPAGSASDSVLSTPAVEPARVAICVLPFTNMSGDPEQEYFSDGMTEDIITELSRWRLLAVRSRWTLTIAHDAKGAIADTLQPDKMPTSYMIDRAGIVRQVNSGFVPSDAPEIEKRLQDLAAGP